MATVFRTDSDHNDFRSLVVQLDKDLQQRYGEEQAFFDQFNKLTKIRHVVVVYDGEQAIGCGAIKEYTPQVAEVKRMFVAPLYRGKGIALQVLSELERWAQELGYNSCILETGKKQPEAIRLYEKAGYHIIPNYGQYADVEMSLCMEKELGRG